MICQVCQSTIFSGDIFTGEFEIGKQEAHHSNLASFRASANASCYICRTLWNRFTAIDIASLTHRPGRPNPTRFCPILPSAAYYSSYDAMVQQLRVQVAFESTMNVGRKQVEFEFKTPSPCKYHVKFCSSS
jgi:hypothetical protein